MTGVLIKEAEGNLRDIGKGHVFKIEAETRVLWIQAKEHLEPPEAHRGMEGFLEPLEGAWFS